MEALAARLPADAIVFDEALTFSPEVTQYLPPRGPGSFFQTRGGSLGVGIPGAIGAKLAHPDRTVVGFTGDGGSMYTIQALWTAAHHRIGAKFVILEQRRLPAAAAQHPAVLEGPRPARRTRSRRRSTWATRTSGSTCWPRRWASTPCASTTREEIGPALDAALADDRPFLIDLVVNNDVRNDVARGKHLKAGQS